jgi:hypothetical protein
MTDPLVPQTGSPGYGETTPVTPSTGTTGSTTGGTYGGTTSGTTSGTYSGGYGDTSGGSTVDVAKSEGRRVADDAAEGGKHVAQVAKDEAASVAGEAQYQARSLLDQAGSELSSHASAQKESLVTWLRELADELRSMAGATSGSEGPRVATGLAERGADYAQRTASWLGDREPRAVLDEVGLFARRRPGTFLLVAAGAGILVGRLTRGLAAGADGGAGSRERRLVTPDIPVATAGTYDRNGGTLAADSWAGGPAVEDQWATPASSAASPASERVAPYREGEP